MWVKDVSTWPRCFYFLRGVPGSHLLKLDLPPCRSVRGRKKNFCPSAISNKRPSDRQASALTTTPRRRPSMFLDVILDIVSDYIQYGCFFSVLCILLMFWASIRVKLSSSLFDHSLQSLWCHCDIWRILDHNHVFFVVFNECYKTLLETFRSTNRLEVATAFQTWCRTKNRSNFVLFLFWS